MGELWKSVLTDIEGIDVEHNDRYFVGYINITNHVMFGRVGLSENGLYHQIAI